MTNIDMFALIALAMIILLGIWNTILTVQMSSTGKKYKRFMRNSSGKNLETALEEYMESVSKVLNKYENVEKKLEKLQEQMDRGLQRWSALRYNAFSDTGSDLSYSIAILDNFYNGFIMTGIYGRNETINYAKPIIAGESKYPLSVEEQMVLDRCMKKGSK